VELTLTLKDQLLRESVRGEKSVDIAKFLESVPSARIVSGDPHVSVRVFVEPPHKSKLLAVVRDVCTVSTYTELELLTGRR
jgi:hypothetical protein